MNKITVKQNFVFPNHLLTTTIFKIPLSYLEHNKELVKRFIQIFVFFIVFFTTALISNKVISSFFQRLLENVKFFQTSPGQYFLVSLEISFYLTVFLESPFLWNHCLNYFLPVLKKKNYLIFTFLGVLSCCLFFLAIWFSWFIFIPIALSFILNYTENILEPLWSFKEFIDFSFKLSLSSIYIFQIPLFQIILGFTGIFSSKNLFSFLKIILLISTILGAIFTPSTDPLTQGIFSLAIFFLYFFGLIIVFYLEKFKLIY